MRAQGPLGKRGRRPHAVAAPLLVALLLGGVAGCSSGSAKGSAATTASPSPDDVRILQPGAPGESATTVGPDAVKSPSAPSHSDIAFMQMMVPHHAQALEMARLATTRAGSPQVAALARRIDAAQGPEIIAMAAWLTEHDVAVPKHGEDVEQYDHGRHGHTAMAGMMTPAQLRELAAARGRRFDRLFLQGMIRHHLGALAMADTLAADNVDVRVQEMAADVVAGQTAEVERMRVLLRSL